MGTVWPSGPIEVDRAVQIPISAPRYRPCFWSRPTDRAIAACRAVQGEGAPSRLLSVYGTKKRIRACQQQRALASARKETSQKNLMLNVAR